MISEVDPTPSELAQVARLLHRRNEIDGQIAAIIQRPVAAGHLGEWIASAVFDIELEPSATTASIDDRFRAGKLQGKTVNIKWYLKREGLLDMTEADVLDYYLVMTGRQPRRCPHAAAEGPGESTTCTSSTPTSYWPTSEPAGSRSASPPASPRAGVW
jgi:hypothetical protein